MGLDVESSAAGGMTRLNWGYHLGGQPPYIQYGNAKQCQTVGIPWNALRTHGIIMGVLLSKRKITERKWELGDVMWESGLTHVTF